MGKNVLLGLALLACTAAVQADIYKCPKGDGSFAFTDKPCDEGAKLIEGSAESASLEKGIKTNRSDSDAALTARQKREAELARLEKEEETARRKREAELAELERAEEIARRKKEAVQQAAEAEKLKKELKEKIRQNSLAYCVRIRGQRIRPMETNDVYHEVAWMVELVNRCGRPFTVDVTFKFLDDDGFLVAQDTKYNKYIKPYGVVEVYDSDLIKPHLAITINKTAVNIEDRS